MTSDQDWLKKAFIKKEDIALLHPAKQAEAWGQFAGNIERFFNEYAKLDHTQFKRSKRLPPLNTQPVLQCKKKET